MAGGKPEKPEKPGVGSDFSVLFPGTRVEIETPKGKIAWTVYPVGFRKMRKFSEGIGRALSAFGSVQIVKGASFEEHTKQLLPVMLPVVLEHLLDLVAECCVPETGVEVDVLDLPHWHAVPIIEAWFVESFGSEEKVRPLVAAVERAMKKMTGQSVDLWGSLSQLSSGQDTDSTISSTEDNPASPTEDGASPK